LRETSLLPSRTSTDYDASAIKGLQ
jgi:hypothetical protein